MGQKMAVNFIILFTIAFLGARAAESDKYEEYGAVTDDYGSKGDDGYGRTKEKGNYGEVKEGGDYGGTKKGDKYGEAKEEGTYGGAKEGDYYGGAKGGDYGEAKGGDYGEAKGGDYGEAKEGGYYGGAKEGGDYGGTKEGGYYGGAKEGGDYGGTKEGSVYGGDEGEGYYEEAKEDRDSSGVKKSDVHGGDKDDDESGEVITDLSGRPVPSLTASRTVGHAGAILLQDTNLLSHLAHFTREKIPERIVHAKGNGAHGYFEVTHDITNYTKAALFSKIGKKTKLFARFSTIQFEAGSADTIHDGRGFAVKFYTEQGNWDLLMLNIIVFPTRDPMLFPSLIRSRKRNPVSGLMDADMFWDFTSLRPETTHHIVQIFSDLGYPANNRHMSAGAVQAFRLVNADNKAVFCKFHLIPDLGLKFMSPAKGIELAGTHPDFFRQDLFDAIAREDFPSWTLKIQIMTMKEAAHYRWNPFDVTKVWLEEQFPLMPVGKLVLNKNPTDFFTETEVVAFNPSTLVPGIELTTDPEFHGRSFIYLDTQRYRLGANFQQFSINKPHVPINTYERDGLCAVENGQGRPNYFPNSVDDSYVSPVGAEKEFFLKGKVVREDTRDDDDFSQPKIFWDKLSKDERKRLVENIAQSLCGARVEVQQRALGNFKKVDEEFAEAIQAYLDGMPDELKWNREKFKY